MTGTHTPRLLTVAVILMMASAPAWTQSDSKAESPLRGDSPLVELLLTGDWTRAEMAESLLRALEVAAYTPPDCEPGNPMFSDVPATSPFCRWIEELSRRGITSGCDASNYCPTASVDRQQMAVFVVRAIEAAKQPVYSSGWIDANWNERDDPTWKIMQIPIDEVTQNALRDDTLVMLYLRQYGTSSIYVMPSAGRWSNTSYSYTYGNNIAGFDGIRIELKSTNGVDLTEFQYAGFRGNRFRYVLIPVGAVTP